MHKNKFSFLKISPGDISIEEKVIEEKVGGKEEKW